MTKRKSDYELIEQAVRAYWNTKESDRLMAIVPQWIPVSERLPEPRRNVLICTNTQHGRWVGEGEYFETTENHVIWKGYRWHTTYWDDEVVAWMYLPEPYKGGEEE